MSHNECFGDFDDDALMVRVQERSAGAFEALIDRYQAPLIGFFFANARDRQLAEDLTQETFLRVYDQAWDYLPSGKFRGWLYRVARNLLIDTVRRQSRDALVRAVKCDGDEPFDLATLTGDLLSPAESADRSEFTNLVGGLIDELPYEQRLTFILHHLCGLALPEVAEIMETSVSTSKSRLRLAREKLQERVLAAGIADPRMSAVDSENKSREAEIS